MLHILLYFTVLNCTVFSDVAGLGTVSQCVLSNTSRNSQARGKANQCLNHRGKSRDNSGQGKFGFQPSCPAVNICCTLFLPCCDMLCCSV